MRLSVGGGTWPVGGVVAAPSPPPTATLDPLGRISGWSDGARLLLGYPFEEVVGRRATSLIDEDGSTWAAGAPPAGLHSWSGTVTLRHRDGHRMEVGLLAQRGAGEWLLVANVPLLSRPDGPLTILGFEQSPCMLALFDTQLRCLVANADMRRALGLPDGGESGARLVQLVPSAESENVERAMRQSLESGTRQEFVAHLWSAGPGGDRDWALSVAPLGDPGHPRGVCLAARDTTELDEARRRLALVNEASSHIGRTLDMASTAQELADVAVPDFADFVAVDLLASIGHGGEPPTGPVVTDSVELRRVAQQSVLDGVPESVVPVGGVSTFPAHAPPAACLRAGRAGTYQRHDPLFLRWMNEDEARGRSMREFGFHSVIAVPIRARGTTLGTVLFSRHRHPKPFGHDDVLLAEEITARAAVCIDNARRYTSERTTSVTLQRSLLPHNPPPHSAVDIASRYLPATPQAGVGGDWFDIIPLSGARVGLVIGDVVGHGLPASVTMARLRTTVRTLADMDLSPDELLTHLDDLVIRMSAEADADEHTLGDVGATCLYAVYDPISRRCTLARAGHPMPALVTPGGDCTLIPMPAGPPLGLGGLPFEATELELPEGSVLALFTDGLIDIRGRSIDASIELLCRALSIPDPSLEDVCENVLTTALPSEPEDDVALLLARTHGLDADRVATWDIPSEAAAVPDTRRYITDTLTEWGLEETAFTTELVVTELVTNAIRHGKPPVRLRLIRDHHLICEVSDGSSAAPHLRRARLYDEGGRGLMLTAQLTRRWGTRHHHEGKTIWAEQ